MDTKTLSVENTSRRTTTGGRICGMRVTFPDGYVVDFICRTTKRDARKQAIERREREEAQ